MSSLEKAIDFYDLLPEELEERETILEEIQQNDTKTVFIS
jgi:hypothetical protein